MARRRRRSGLALRFGLLAGALAIVAFAAELALPRFPPHLGTMQRLVRGVDGAEHYALQPGIEVSFSGMFEPISPAITWQVNQQGLRASAAVALQPERFRIATYGDSEAFGWSVGLDDTLQRRMESIDPRVEVLNFGVPGYNAEDVAERMEATLSRFGPDLALYLVNKNDLDERIEVSAPLLRSELLLRLRFLYQVVVTKPWRKRARRSPERLGFLAGQIDRIAAHCADHRVPLVLAFMRTRTWDGVRRHAAPGGFSANAGPDGTDAVRVVDVQALLRNHPKADSHLSIDAYRELAGRLCSELAGGNAGCIPNAASPARRPPPRPVVAARPSS